ncbi:LYR motif-containing protein 4 isoform 1-T3 [Macrochelys suwanniensis]
MAASSRAQVLRLYRALLRESQRFTAYGYRTYAIRRIRDAFRENKHLKDSEEIQTLLKNARTNLEIIHRQLLLGVPISGSRDVIQPVKKAVCPQDERMLLTQNTSRRLIWNPTVVSV